ncbi:GNAT family N-acetyltransferase [Vibrio mediterranei]|uniref:GNAT family N-acetyltransferase n=1 Tax=Vibrio mediterranei TaxID=689 RepID=UPI00148BF288|nr:GNAT family N-acetyltransferase [Vibrio mediterranei]NOH31462.1 GNAT family N-acetyltransferase [Vibrio mediterranei]
MRLMEIKIEPVLLSDFEEVFATVKRGLFDHVDAVFGWDDQFQRHRLKTEYETDWFHWLYVDNKRAGLLCFKPYDDALHVHFLVIEASYQGRQIGATVMTMVHDQAITEMKQQVTLSSFKRNLRAISFYESLGYEVVDNDENFVSLVWRVAS